MQNNTDPDGQLTPVIPVLQRLRLEGSQLRASLGYIVSSSPAQLQNEKRLCTGLDIRSGLLMHQICCFVSLDRVSLCSSGCFGIYSVDQADLKVLPAFVS